MGFIARYEPDGRVARPLLQAPPRDTHKYQRGHALVFSGPALATGASRLAAEAALRIGAGLVTIVGDRQALSEHAAHVTAIMLREEAAGGAAEQDPLFDERTRSALIGPGAGRGEETRLRVERLLKSGCAIVLDADALTSFSECADRLFGALRARCVLTPHEGEFARLFPDIDLKDRTGAAEAASIRSGAVLLLKGAVTTIAAPDGRIAHNVHSTPWLATAGSGDTLAGMILGLLAQKCDPFDAAAIASWCHGQAGILGGPGLTADDFYILLPQVLADLMD